MYEELIEILAEISQSLKRLAWIESNRRIEELRKRRDELARKEKELKEKEERKNE